MSRVGEWIIRTGRVDEVAWVLALWQVAGENADRPTDRPVALRGLLERDPDALLVAAEGDRLVGNRHRRVGRMARVSVPAGGAA